MCKCTPGIRTPFCGKIGCEWPPQKNEIARNHFTEKLNEMANIDLESDCSELEKSDDGALDHAVKLLDSAIWQMENGFVRCDNCGEQEETKTLDFVYEVKESRDLIKKLIG